MNFDDYDNLPTNNVVIQMLGGAIAGIMEHCALYPVDSVKTRMQSLSHAPSFSTANGTRLIRPPTTITGTLRDMIVHEGLTRPVRGIHVILSCTGPAHAAYFCVYESLRDELRRHRRGHYVPYSMCPVLAGAVATVVHDAFMTPADAVKQRMQMANSMYTSCRQCIRHMLKYEGVGAFYRAYLTQTAMNVPYHSLHFAVYDHMQHQFNPRHEYLPSVHLLSGAFAGALAAALTTPLDVCKTLLNTQELGRVRGLGQAARLVYRTTGVSGFARGIWARICYQIPGTAICWTVYETMKFLLLSNSGGGGGSGSDSHDDSFRVTSGGDSGTGSEISRSHVAGNRITRTGSLSALSPSSALVGSGGRVIRHDLSFEQ